MVAVAPFLIAPATLEDLLAIPAHRRRHELIEGSIVEKEATSGEHGGAQADLVTMLNGPFGRRPGGRFPGGWWFVTEVEVYFDESNTLRPDVAGWRRERLPERPRGTPLRVRPDWVCEILSTNRRNDLLRKKRVYHRHEVPYYWIVDPIEEMLSVLRWTPDGYLEVLLGERSDIVRAEPFEAIPLAVGVLFGDEPPDSQSP